MESFDCVVVGAGLAGLQCARLVGRRGVRVLLVDRKERLDRPVQTTGIFVRRTFEEPGFPVAFLGRPVRRVALHSPGGRALTIVSARDEFRVGKMGAIYRHYLRDAECAGVEFRPATGFVSLRPDGNGSIVELAGGSESVRARFVIGADGARSRVASALGLDRNRSVIVGLEDVYRRRSNGSEPRIDCLLDPRVAPGYIAWVVDDGEEIHVGVAGYPGRFDPARSLDGFRGWARRVVDLETLDDVERRGGLIPVGGVLRRITCDRGLVVGDAAGAASPLTAGGLDAALRYSSVAAEAVARLLARGDPRALEVCSGERIRPRFASRLFMRRLWSAMGSPRIVEAAFAILASRPGRFLARHVFFARASFPDVVSYRSAGTIIDPVPR